MIGPPARGSAVFSLIPARYVVLALLCLITVVNYVQRNAISGSLTDMQKELHIDLGDAKDALAEFFLTYALMQIPSGWLAQRWGTRRALTFFTVGWSLATGLMALATNLPTIRLLRWLQGAFQAGIFPCATLIFAEWVPLSRRALATGLLTAFMLVGAAFSNVFTGLLIGELGWRGLMAVFALPGLLWAALFYWWFRDRPQDHPSVSAAELALLTQDRPPPGAAGVGPTPWLVICLSVPLILICIQQFCRAGANRLLDQYFVLYLQEARGMPIDRANYTASVPLWAAVFGSLLGGWLSDWVLARTGSRRAGRQGVAAASLAASIALYLLAGTATDVRVAVSAISLAF